MKLLIVDDELHAREALKMLIQNNFPEHQVVATAENLPDGVKELLKHKPDVLFLDIEMPRYSGLEIVDFVDMEHLNTAIVFVTAYNQYAVDAFELSAVDYILKPIRLDSIKRALDRVSAIHQGSTNLLALKENLTEKRISKLAIPIAYGVQLVEPKDLLYMKADGSYTHIFLVNSEKLTTSKNLQSYTALEHNHDFIRVSRSYLVNLHRIKKIIKTNGGTLIMEDDEEISVSPEQRTKIEEFFKTNSI